MSKKRLLIVLIAYAALIAALLCALMIFGFSSQNGETSSDTSRKFTRIVLTIVSPSFRSLDEEAKDAYVSSIQHPVRKAAHFTEYALLGFLLLVCQRFMLIAYRNAKARYLPGVLLAFAGCVGFAATDEWHQSFTAGRGAAFGDVMIDSLGAMTGILLFFLFRYIYLRVKARRKKKTETV